jgi:tRNA U34 5-methylaminomethyl-2-thiouridine-forming methyltransferase MnmC
MAAVQLLEVKFPEQSIEIYTFEKDLDALRLACAHPQRFPHTRHALPHTLLKKGQWEKNSLRVQLLEGDFEKQISRASPADILFWDPFGQKVNQEMWSREIFDKVFQLSSPKAQLVTYSASTATRARLLDASWYVGEIPGTGIRKHSTLASKKQASNCLNRDFLRKMQVAAEQRESLHEEFIESGMLKRLKKHPQFAAQS